jgi:hypothetical protein
MKKTLKKVICYSVQEELYRVYIECKESKYILLQNCKQALLINLDGHTH